MRCRSCGHAVNRLFLDLGSSPPSNSYLTSQQLEAPETFYPLKVLVCDNCFLVQMDEHKRPHEIFSGDYAYFSSVSTSWLEHCRKYSDDVVDRFGIGSSSKVIEIASNDGYLLKYFKDRGIPVLGIEPASSVAKAAISKGIETVIEFFGRKLATDLAKKVIKADLLVANNVLAHVPDINDFVAGMAIALNPDGVLTIEFPHLMRLVEGVQFDTIYHEHYSYLSLTALMPLFRRHRLAIFDVEGLPTHGGSLRIYAQHSTAKRKAEDRVRELLASEAARGMKGKEYYSGFQGAVDSLKRDILGFLIDEKRQGRRVVGYGAAAKGNTLFNYCGVRKDLVEFVVDNSPSKEGRFLPGSRIPILHPDALNRERPDTVIIIPWNIKDEIAKSLATVRGWKPKVVTFVPKVEAF
jgi:SAM-dependent methyltransferase